MCQQPSDMGIHFENDRVIAVMRRSQSAFAMPIAYGQTQCFGVVKV